MAIRPVFCAKDTAPFYRIADVNFEYFSGFSVVQKQRCIVSLHNSFLKLRPQRKVLEISSKGMVELGVKLSAFNLQIADSNPKHSVECAFQGSKVFEKGGPYADLLGKTSRQAKKDPRLQESGRLIAFNYLGTEFPNDPKDFFYNWIYIKALHSNSDYANQILEYDSFTDIEFNPQKSFNCQAKAAAIYIGLHKAGLLEEALQSRDDFLRIVYGK